MPINAVYIEGRICNDPELRHLGSGTAVCELRIAVNEQYQGQDKSHFFDVVTWKKTAERVAQFSKGDLIFVDGKLQMDEWSNQKGEKRTKVKVVAWRVKQFASLPAQDAPPPQQPPDDNVNLDDIPF